MKKKIRKWLYGKCPGFKGAFPYYGTKVYFPKNSYIFNLACDQGTYEHDMVKLILTLIKADTYYFDVGANIGLMAIPILYNRPTCKCLSFEPSPNAIPYLLRTVEESQFHNRWVVINKAVGEELGELDFNVSSASLSAFDGFKNTGRAPVEKTIKVPVTTIDHVWAAPGKPDVSVIKIDVEGAEIRVLKGATECIKKCKPYILIEWNAVNLKANGYKPNDLIIMTNEIGYGIYSLPNIVKINNESELLVQMLFTENFLLCPI
ncbi:MAG: hypothetical protein CVU62_05760 [Deltaproteobacteria bacterium HGW-Deltaproteobacteria-2]|nr:MAG: hypothetical protein CVU62_05760 [Deltaproteobacteria bacterium HGW-Deltaproteobacteria-2]